ncbi:TPA: hypothetical protein RQN23_000652 [Aeromonas veronii]|nr:hypothetical protein [Aeromonas veronii]
MRITSPILYSSDFDKVMQFLHSHIAGKESSHHDFFSKATTNLIDSGVVSSENISSYIKYLFEALNTSIGNDIGFSKNLRSAVSCICASRELSAQHLDDLKPLVQFVIDNSYDFNASAPKNKSYLMYRGWTGDDYGNIASSYLSNKSVSIEHYKIVIESYLKLLEKEFNDFGAEAYSKISKMDFSNENIFKSVIINSLSKLPEHARENIGKQCLSFMDNMGCKIASKNSNFILNCSLFSDFVDVVYTTMNEQRSQEQDKPNIYDDANVIAIADLLKNITSPNYNHHDLSSIDFRLFSEQHYNIILESLLVGINKCKDALNLYSNNEDDRSINVNITKNTASQLMTTLFLRVSTLLMNKGFNQELFETILSNKLMDDLASVDKDQALIIELGRSHLWQYPNIAKHWNYLLETDSMQSVIEASPNLSESDIEKIYSRLMLESKDNIESKNDVESVIVSRLYNNHYAPKLIAGEKVAESKLAPIMSSLLRNAHFNETDLALFTKADLKKIISNENFEIRKELSKPYNSAINEMIVSTLLNNAINEIAAESGITKHSQKLV